MSNPDTNVPYSPWPHRFGLTLVCATFPLIWVGGLVTTYDAGMAVPDWPNTYGYNLFLYPISTWISGPWDLFIEHGHRLLGAFVGLLTIAFAVSVWRCDDRSWMKWLSLGAIAGVVGQGVLGGMRVLLVDRDLAMIHGCTGPMFFAFCVILCSLTSKRWREASDLPSTTGGSRLCVLATITLLLAASQIVLGASLRHMPVTASYQTFQVAVVFHVGVAVLLLAHAAALWLRVRMAGQEGTIIRRASTALAALTLLQVCLGMATWLVKYSWPAWASRWAIDFTIEADGLLQSIIVTSHVAMGSLILALSSLIVLRTVRVVLPVSRFSVPVSHLVSAGL